MSQDIDKRLTDAVVERDRLSALAQRIAGRKEAADKALLTVQTEIRAKNLDPATLGETISQLETAYEVSVSAFEKDLQTARDHLTPYQDKTP